MKKFISQKLENAVDNLSDLITDEVYPLCDDNVVVHEETAVKNIDIMCQYLAKCIGFKVTYKRLATVIIPGTVRIKFSVVINDVIVASINAYIYNKGIYNPVAISQVLEPVIQKCHDDMQAAFEAVKPSVHPITAARIGNYAKLTDMITAQLNTVLNLVNIIERSNYVFLGQFKFNDGKVSFLVEDAFSLARSQITLNDDILHNREAYKKFIADLCIYSHELKQYHKSKKRVAKLNKAKLLICDEYKDIDLISIIPEPAYPVKPDQKALYTIIGISSDKLKTNKP